MDLQSHVNHAKDGMRYPAIDQLVTKTTSKYRLVMAAALRAKQLKYNKERCSFFSAAEGTCSGP